MDDPPMHGSKQPAAKADTQGTGARTRLSREETTTAILDAAEELFSRRDPTRVTVREIAEKAGVTHPLVHQYVGSKSDILDAVIKRGAPARHDDHRRRIRTTERSCRLCSRTCWSRRVHTQVDRPLRDGRGRIRPV